MRMLSTLANVDAVVVKGVATGLEMQVPDLIPIAPDVDVMVEVTLSPAILTLDGDAPAAQLVDDDKGLVRTADTIGATDVSRFIRALGRIVTLFGRRPHARREKPVDCASRRFGRTPV